MLMNVLPWAFGGLLLAMLLNFWRLLRGPDAVDRALARLLALSFPKS